MEKEREADEAAGNELDEGGVEDCEDETEVEEDGAEPKLPKEKEGMEEDCEEEGGVKGEEKEAEGLEVEGVKMKAGNGLEEESFGSFILSPPFPLNACNV